MIQHADSGHSRGTRVANSDALGIRHDFLFGIFLSAGKSESGMGGGSVVGPYWSVGDTHCRVGAEGNFEGFAWGDVLYAQSRVR